MQEVMASKEKKETHKAEQLAQKVNKEKKAIREKKVNLERRGQRAKKEIAVQLVRPVKKE
ncbi:MAG: hypothetical protein EBV76_11400 [Gammaproteobacteria bacterium]|nr:hypothetical protein [Gammaproteobacteria bacterium]